MADENIPVLERNEYGLKEFVKNVCDMEDPRCKYCYDVRFELLAKTAKHVYGIEIVESSHLNAETLKTENNINNLTNILGDVSEKLKTINNYSFIVLDPPRKGCSKEVIDSIIDVKPKNILYISCGPATLARDLGYLKEHYTINFVKPFDMFPQTHHVETLVSLTFKD